MARALATGHGHTEEKDECGHLLTTQSVADGLVHGRATPVGACEMCRLVTPPPPQMLHLAETLRELRVCERAGRARKTPGNSTCLSLEPCCLNQALCRWPLLLCLLLFQLL